MRLRRRAGVTGWRRVGAGLALFALVLQSLSFLGHSGFASGEARAADGSSVSYIEICTPRGIERVVWNGPESSPETADESQDRSDSQSRVAPCLLCASILAPGKGEAEAAIAVRWPRRLVLIPESGESLALIGRHCRPTLSRAPPTHL